MPELEDELAGEIEVDGEDDDAGDGGGGEDEGGDGGDERDGQGGWGRAGGGPAERLKVGVSYSTQQSHSNHIAIT